MGSVSTASVPGGVGGRTGSLGQTGSQGQWRQGCRHALVVIHPGNSVDTISKELILSCVHVASLLKLQEGAL